MKVKANHTHYRELYTARHTEIRKLVIINTES